MIAPLGPVPGAPAAYIRVSSERQADEGFSLDVQADTIRQYCKLRQWPEPVLYTDAGISGYGESAVKRPAWSRLMADAEARAVDAVVVVQIDRWSRDLRTILDSVLRLGAAGCAFVSIVESLDFSTPIGKMALAMLGAMAQYSSDHKSVEAKRVQSALWAEGRWQWRAPYGARLVDGKLLLDPELAPTLARILTLVAQEPTTRVAERLNTEGVPSPGSRLGEDRWGTTDRAVLWWSSTLDSLIEGGAWLLDQPEPYPALWLAARNKPRATRTRRSAQTWMLTGLMRCGSCGGPVLQYPKKGRRRVHCLWRGKTGRPACAISRLTWSDLYEARMLAEVAALPDPDLGEAVATTPDAAALLEIAEEERRVGLRFQRRVLDDAGFERELADLAARRLALLPGGMGERAVLDDLPVVRDGFPLLEPADQNVVLRDWVDYVLIDPDGELRVVWKAIIRQGCRLS